MENRNTAEQIEQYLHDKMAPEERLAFEHRMKTDKDFSAEVDFQRQLHQEFSDPKKLELRDIMAVMMQESTPAPRPAYLIWASLVFGLFLAAGILWYWASHRQAIPAPEIKVEAPSQQPVAQNDGHGTHISGIIGDTNRQADVPPKVPTPSRPIAQADPAAYLPNPEFEAHIKDMVRSTEEPASFTQPAPGATFKTVNGAVKIKFQGSAPADDDTGRYPLILKIFDNRQVKPEPLFRFLPELSHRDADHWTFSVSEKLALKPGLYYYTLERQADSDLIFIGKFRVE